MHAEFWLERWSLNEIGFHIDRVNPDLIAHEDWLIGGGDHRVLVPLCGKSLDLEWIARKGNTAVGVELSQLAVEAIFERAGKTPTITRRGELTLYRADRLLVYCGDIFALRPDDLGPIDRIWDRAALVALPRPMRARYVPHLRTLVDPGSRVLQASFVYNDCDKQGPPHSVPEDEVRRLYHGAEVDLFERQDLSGEIREAWAQAGMTLLMAHLYRITLPKAAK